MNIVEDKDLVLKLGSGPVLNIKKGIRRLLGHSQNRFPKILFSMPAKIFPFFRDLLVWKRRKPKPVTLKT